jgi:methyl-accepting chemotaxis protein
MAQTAGQIAAGDLTQSVSPRSEQDLLGQSFKQMMTGLRQVVGKILHTATELSSTSVQLSLAANQAGQASSQIAPPFRRWPPGPRAKPKG